MKERILEFLKRENKSSVQLANEIGVQPSGISHILSGRNKPSLDFVIKMLERYKYLSSDWLLFGRGEMYKEVPEPTLFSIENTLPEEKHREKVGYSKTNDDARDDSSIHNQQATLSSGVNEIRKAVKIIVFYNDHTYHEYFPAPEDSR